MAKTTLKRRLIPGLCIALSACMADGGRGVAGEETGLASARIERVQPGDGSLTCPELRGELARIDEIIRSSETSEEQERQADRRDSALSAIGSVVPGAITLGAALGYARAQGPTGGLARNDAVERRDRALDRKAWLAELNERKKC